MVDPEDPGFRKDRAQCAVQGLGGGEVSSERFLQDDTRIAGATRLLDPFRNRLEYTGWDRQVMCRACRAAERLSQLSVCREILIITVNVLEQLQELAKSRFVDTPTVLRNAGTGTSPKLLNPPS